jgi:hypothetical protein
MQADIVGCTARGEGIGREAARAVALGSLLRGTACCGFLRSALASRSLLRGTARCGFVRSALASRSLLCRSLLRGTACCGFLRSALASRSLLRGTLPLRFLLRNSSGRVSSITTPSVLLPIYVPQPSLSRLAHRAAETRVAGSVIVPAEIRLSAHLILLCHYRLPSLHGEQTDNRRREVASRDLSDPTS